MVRYLEAFGHNANKKATRFIIEQSEGEAGVSLVEVSDDGIFDNWFDSIEEAKTSANVDFGIDHKAWKPTDSPPSVHSVEEMDRLNKLHDRFDEHFRNKSGKHDKR